jgi:hypothetical protein
MRGMTKGLLQAGFVLGELLLMMAVIAVAIGIGTAFYANIRSSVKADEQAERMVQLAADIRQYIGKSSGDYTSLSPALANSLGLVRQPMTWDVSALLDVWGNTMNIGGSGAWRFSLTAGGATQPMSPSECAAVARRLADTAYRVTIGAAVVVSNGWTSGGSAYKTAGGVPPNGAISQTSLTAGCSEANTIVGASFLER